MMNIFPRQFPEERTTQITTKHVPSMEECTSPCPVLDRCMSSCWPFWFNHSSTGAHISAWHGIFTAWTASSWTRNDEYIISAEGALVEVGPQGACCCGMKQWSGYPTTGTKNVPTNTEIYYPRNNGEKLINDDCSILQHIIMFYTTTRVWRGRCSGSDKWVPSSRKKSGNNDQDGSKAATESTGILKLLLHARQGAPGSSGSYFIFREDIIYGQLETAGKVEWNIQWMWPRHG